MSMISNPLCKYSDIFGKPGEGLHKYRLFGVAIVDVIFTFIVAFILYKVYPKYNFATYSIFLFSLGIVMHRLFCVRTAVDKFLFN